MGDEVIKVLLVEDDEDDYVLVRDYLSGFRSPRFELEWVDDYDPALETMKANRHDVYILDYRLKQEDGLHLLAEANEKGFNGPVVFLTGYEEHEVDMEATKRGVSDYLVKGRLTGHLLERSIRYAMERKRTERKLRHLSSQLLNAQERERKLVAQEIHDSIGGKLTAIKYTFERQLEQTGMNSGEEDVSSQELLSMLQEAIREVRRISTSLRPAVLDDLGILSAIQWQCREFQKVYSWLKIETRLEAKEQEIPESLKIVIYRVLQESLNNIARHSEAERVFITLEKRKTNLLFSVRDNGVGFDPKALEASPGHPRGLGLLGMRERVELSGGVFFVESVKDSGTTVQASWSC